MRNIISIFIVCLLIFGGLGAVVSGNISKTYTYTYTDLVERVIVPISNTDSEIIFLDSNFNQYKLKGLKDKNLFEKTERIKNNFDTYDYLIITTEELSSAISTEFIVWKTYVGFNIKIVYVTDDEINNQEGEDVCERIRNFLREYYEPWGIEYVLIVGDHQTIPMRYCYPDPTNHINGSGSPGTGGGEVPTDYYYADLTSSDADSWDSDGDSYYGEYGHDIPDFEAEVFVGRIPTSDKSRITYTLDKIVEFEHDNGNWKNAALHAGAFYYLTNEDFSGNPAMDAARCMYEIENDFMSGWSITHFSEQEGLEVSVYDWDALTYSAFNDAWREGEYGIVNWGSHAYMDCAARKVWYTDNGNGVPENFEISWPRFINTNSNLDDDYPSILFAMGCLIGSPEPYQNGNLGIDLLTEPGFGSAVGIISSTRTPYGALNWPTDPGGCESYCYKFNEYIINQTQSIGDALYNSKYFCHSYYGWNQWYEYMNMYIFNLYGDPSLVRAGISSNHPPNTPLISGPTYGKIGISYNYSFVSIDDDNDELSYSIEWGDGIEEVIGSFPSGFEANASHTWNEKGSYTIRARAFDGTTNSDWGEYTVSMPKSKTICLNFNLLNLIFERFPDMFSLLR
jgi:hypothetical protein